MVTVLILAWAASVLVPCGAFVYWIITDRRGLDCLEAENERLRIALLLMRQAIENASDRLLGDLDRELDEDAGLVELARRLEER